MSKVLEAEQHIFSFRSKSKKLNKAKRMRSKRKRTAYYKMIFKINV